jgi:hypothetical protein
MATTVKTKDKKAALDDACRALLRDWQPGQRKEVSDWCFSRRGHKSKYARCVELGYLKIVRTRKQGQSWSTYIVERTDKPLPPRRYGRPRRHCLFPWGVAEHWDVIQKSPLHAQRKMFQDMVPDSLGWRERRARCREIDATYPEVKTRNQLASARKFLTDLLTTGDCDPDAHAAQLVPMFASPQRIARALVMLMIKPVIREGTITRFEPLGEGEQMEELKKTDSGRSMLRRLVELYQPCP